MADVLEQRGVYQGALEYAREAVSLKPDDARGLHEEAEIFSDLNQFNECISAAEAAIRASDGKFSYMHFRLGWCYFRTENWTMAENSFRIAAEGDKTDFVSAFDLGLSLRNEGRTLDGNEWLREALRRNPDSETRTKILNLLQ
jgi:tetratricopeptide (TPR) repeat protein